MANFVFNSAKGRVAELYNRVQTGDPSTSALVVVILATTNLESDATLIDKTTMAAMVSGTTREVTNTNYARKVLNSATSGITAISPDLVNDRMDLALPNMTWTAIAAGSGWSKLLICYRPTTASADSAIIPLTAHDFVITPDGSDITAQVGSSVFFRAS